ncbi:MAG: hypothetical protein GQ474_05920 [Sulfurimonas sp.]|nr:hypothetical protein [Sulfurimonas sp.]
MLDTSIHDVKEAFFKQFFPKIKNQEDYIVCIAPIVGLERLSQYAWVKVDENISEEVGVIAVRKECI